MFAGEQFVHWGLHAYFIYVVCGTLYDLWAEMHFHFPWGELLVVMLAFLVSTAGAGIKME